MKKVIVFAVIGLALASCTQTERGAGTGALIGGVAGGAITGNVRGAAVGAGLGAVGGALIGNANERQSRQYDRRNGSCEYVDRRNGGTYWAPCR